MKSFPLLGIGILAASLLSVGCAHNPGPEPSTTAAANSAAAPATGDAKAQATRGGQLFGQHCANCHGDGGQGTIGAPPLVGKEALPLDPPATAKYRKTPFHTAGDVYAFAKANMPAKDPGTLSQDEYLAVVAFDLQANGVDLTGKAALTPDALATIVLHP
jgi:mono/diheme cytochrome c family protein